MRGMRSGDNGNNIPITQQQRELERAIGGVLLYSTMDIPKMGILDAIPAQKKMLLFILLACVHLMYTSCTLPVSVVVLPACTFRDR